MGDKNYILRVYPQFFHQLADKRYNARRHAFFMGSRNLPLRNHFIRIAVNDDRIRKGSSHINSYPYFLTHNDLTLLFLKTPCCRAGFAGGERLHGPGIIIR